uniref:Uncharacterized protein n=5 Tax=Oryza TaxID=4527 RepID=Q6K362_ORYSJ|nr:hypothetical protein [Oryza sativa Japonica Group]
MEGFRGHNGEDDFGPIVNASSQRQGTKGGEEDRDVVPTAWWRRSGVGVEIDGAVMIPTLAVVEKEHVGNPPDHREAFGAKLAALVL